MLLRRYLDHIIRIIFIMVTFGILYISTNFSLLVCITIGILAGYGLSWVFFLLTNRGVDKVVTPNEIEKMYKIDQWEVWIRLKSMMIPGDELRYYKSGWISWIMLCGRAGVLLIRDGEVIEGLILMMS